MFYNQNIGVEKKDCEYKVFNFNPLKISSEDAIEYLENKKFIFNSSVIATLSNYFEIYLPKYICSYFHPQSELNKGYLYMGISDDGSVSGIPFIGKIPLDFIYHQIDKIFLKFLRFSDPKTKLMVRNSISYEIIKVNTNNLKCTSQPTYNIYIKEQEKIKLQFSKYNKKKQMWDKMFNPNILKLCDMINDESTREIIWSYIKEKSNYSMGTFKNINSHLSIYCDVDDYWTLMTKIKCGHKFEPLEPGKISNVKHDKLNVYNWITEWKDSKNCMLKLAKPKIPKKYIDPQYPIFLLSRSTKMMPEWIENNKNLNLFVLKISFDIKYHCVIEYKCFENNWKKSYRTMKKDGEPMSLSFNMN